MVSTDDRMPDALERSVIYRGFSEAFSAADGGTDVLDEALVPLPPDDNGRAFVETFDTAVSKIACSLHESDHTGREQTSLFEELVRWHQHFGLRRRDTALLPDHISAELEFMHFLTYQEHHHGKDASAVNSLRRAQCDFIDRHLAPLAFGIEKKCPKIAPRYEALARALPEFLRQELSLLRNVVS